MISRAGVAYTRGKGIRSRAWRFWSGNLGRLYKGLCTLDTRHLSCIWEEPSVIARETKRDGGAPLLRAPLHLRAASAGQRRHVVRPGPNMWVSGADCSGTAVNVPPATQIVPDFHTITATDAAGDQVVKRFSVGLTPACDFVPSAERRYGHRTGPDRQPND